VNGDPESCCVTRAVTDGLPVIEVCSLGAVPYLTALETQRHLVAARQSGRIHDRLLLLEHPAVITVGVSGRASRDHVVATPAELQDRGIEILDVRRGGDVTYHGPGQLVGYPVIDLKPDRCDVRRYVRDIEEVLISTVAAFGVEAGRVSGLTGVWVGREKLAAIGVRLSRWVTSHGFALNVTTNLAHFDLIVPCGLQGYGVTSLERLLGTAPARYDLDAVLAGEFGRVFGRRVAARGESPASHRERRSNAAATLTTSC
jgi:lipoyl(octanoyl) transferase